MLICKQEAEGIVIVRSKAPVTNFGGLVLVCSKDDVLQLDNYFDFFQRADKLRQHVAKFFTKSATVADLLGRRSLPRPFSTVLSAHCRAPAKPLLHTQKPKENGGMEANEINFSW